MKLRRPNSAFPVIAPAVIGLLATLLIADMYRYNSDAATVQHAADTALLAALKSDLKDLNEFTAATDSSLYETLSSFETYWSATGQSGDYEYEIEVTVKFKSILPAFISPQPNTITAGVRGIAGPGHSEDIVAIFNLKQPHLQRQGDLSFEMTEIIIADATQTLTLLENARTGLTIIITDEISDPTLCLAFQKQGPDKYEIADKDLIYIGEPKVKIDDFYKHCIAPHPLHACLQDRHIVRNYAEAIKVLSSIRETYGMMSPIKGC